MKEHKDYIDLAKGIGILLVVIGHGPLNNFYINVFHMPLFFFIAGLTFFAPSIEGFETFFMKKVNRILVPWVAFTIISAIAEALFGRVGEGPFNSPLWFLQTMFVAMMVYSMLNIVITNRLRLDVCCFSLPVIVYILAVFLNVGKYDSFGVVRGLEATFFIHFGRKLHYFEKISTKSSVVSLIPACILFVWGGLFSIKHYDLSGCTFVNSGAYTYNLFLSHVTSIGGIIMVLLISLIVKNVSCINWFGKHSLVIVLVHFPVQERLNQVVFHMFTSYNPSIVIKVFISIVSYSVTLLFCVGAIYFCRRFIPKLSGYSNLIPTK